jgi:hypothetical protein
MPETDDYTPDQPMTLGQRLLRTRGAAAVDDEPTGEPDTGATPNTKEPHQNTGAAAQGDSAVQSPSGKPSIGQRMLGGSNPTAGITAHNNDGSPAEMATGTDAAGRPTISVKPTSATSATATPAAAPTPGQRLANFKAPPAAPQLDPNYSATQESVRKDSVVTPKVDAQGNTLQQYKPGFGTRLLRGVSDFMSGGIPAVLKGAVDPTSPGFYGKGAVNNQYTKDEIARQNRLNADKAAVSSMDDEYSQKEKGYTHELTSYNDEAKAAGKADADEIRNKYQTDLNTERTAHNKETEDLRAENNELKAQPKTYEQYVGALETETDPGKKAVLQRIVDRLAPNHDKTKAMKSLSAKDRMKVDAYKRDNGIETDDEMSSADLKKALAASDGPAHTKDRQSFEDHWKKDFDSVESKYNKQRDAVLKSFGADKDAAAYGKKKEEIEPKLADIEAKREAEKSTLQTEKDKEAEQYQIYGKPAKTSQAPPAAAPAQSEDSKIEQPIASVRTGEPAQQKPSPATPGAKSISKTDVQALAQKHGMSYEDAAKQFTGKGYAIQ